jgi:hypothetical protein
LVNRGEFGWLKTVSENSTVKAAESTIALIFEIVFLKFEFMVYFIVDLD